MRTTKKHLIVIDEVENGYIIMHNPQLDNESVKLVAHDEESAFILVKQLLRQVPLEK